MIFLIVLATCLVLYICFLFLYYYPTKALVVNAEPEWIPEYIRIEVSYGFGFRFDYFTIKKGHFDTYDFALWNNGQRTATNDELIVINETMLNYIELMQEKYSLLYEECFSLTSKGEMTEELMNTKFKAIFDRKKINFQTNP